MQRMGMVIGIKPEKIAEYKELHANCWPEILKGIEESNIRNYSIWLHEGEHWSMMEEVFYHDPS